MPDPTQRFSDRVSSYVKYRPSYPNAAIDTLAAACQLGDDSIIADLGSGTGIFSQLLLERGYRVFAVEPNAPMRLAAEQQLNRHSRFTSVDGAAEATTLPDRSVDLAVAAQAFHWFDRDRAKAEFQRILKPDGWAALIWNQRLTDRSPFLRDYETLLMEQATDYNAVNHTNITLAEIEAFFEPQPLTIQRFPNRQSFDYAGLEGRCQSSSYVPGPEHPGYSDFFAALRDLFEKHQRDGLVHFDYETNLYYGHLARMNVQFIPAQASDAQLLSDIAIASKGHWGYPQAQLELWRSQLRVEPDYIERHTVRKILQEGAPAGFFAIAREPEPILDHLWILPASIGAGLGRLAFTQIVTECRSLGIHEFAIISDPNAEPFYLHMGATRIGQVKSVPQNRYLPKLRYVVNPASYNNSP